MGRTERIIRRESKEGLLRELSELVGLESGYWDVAGEWHELSESSRRALLSALGFRVESDETLFEDLQKWKSSRQDELLPPVLVVHREELPLSLTVRAPDGSRGAELEWEFFEEGGKTYSGKRLCKELAVENSRLLLNLPLVPKDGYHYLRVTLSKLGKGGETSSAGCRIIVCPDRCYLPSELEDGARWWGLGVQIPALVSSRNWGIGDFRDLSDLGRAAQKAGAKFLGINPLHVLPPGGRSPYSPSSRFEIQPLFIDLESVPEFRGSKKIKSFLARKKIQEELRELRQAALLDYARIWNVKKEVLALLFEEFEAKHIEEETDRGIAFFQYVEKRGERLQLFAVHSALADFFTESGKKSELWSWMQWPAAFQDPLSPSVKKFAEQQKSKVRMYQYIAWLAESQFDDVQREFAEIGLNLGCYGDLALGADPGGAENWASQSLFVRELSLGAPPDALGPQGQVWGLPAVSPEELRKEAYEPFASLIREQLRHMGALRLDHVMSLFRLFLVPSGMPASEGGYLRYPLHDLAGIVALESQRNKAIIIGEDLGTVPQEVSRCMEQRRMLSYKVFFFLRDGAGFQNSRQYPKNALVVTSTHDLPTLAGYVAGADIELRASLGIISGDQAQSARHERQHERQTIAQMLGTSAANEFSELSERLHGFLAESPSLLQLLQVEDLIGEERQYNLPGTTDEYPNWSRRYSFTTEQLAEKLAHSSILEPIQKERNQGVSPDSQVS